MPKCLNCEKEVKNKYCSVHCQNEHKGKVNREKYYLNPKLCECCSKVIEYDGFVDNWKNRKLNQLPLKIRREIKLKNIKNI